MIVVTILLRLIGQTCSARTVEMEFLKLARLATMETLTMAIAVQTPAFQDQVHVCRLHVEMDD
jgi:hypothetical protein